MSALGGGMLRVPGNQVESGQFYRLPAQMAMNLSDLFFVVLLDQVSAQIAFMCLDIISESFLKLYPDFISLFTR